MKDREQRFMSERGWEGAGILPTGIGDLPAREAATLLGHVAEQLKIVKPQTEFWQGLIKNLKGAKGFIEGQGKRLTAKSLMAVAGTSFVLSTVAACTSSVAPDVEPIPTLASVAAETQIAPSPTEQSLSPEVRNILLKIEEQYGIEIPTQVSEVYTDYSQGEIPNALLALEEARLFEETISLIPGAGYLVQLIIPSRYAGQEIVAGGSYLGYQWPAFLHPRESSSFLHDTLYVSESAAIRLIIPENVSMEDPLPTVGEEYSVLPPLIQISMTSAGIEANTQTEIPWTTHGERLKQTIVHETGHALIDRVRIANSENIEEYRRRSGFYLYNKNTVDIDNPLFKAFAEVNGWRLIPFHELARQYDSTLADRLLAEHPESAETLVWERDFDIWGNLSNRKIRLTPYASYGPIQESFCEYWMVSILYPDILTAEEREFFKKIHEGLRGNPDEFVKSIVSNPEILLP